MVESTIDGVDLQVLVGWMNARGLGEGDLHEPTLIAGGTQNILLRFERSGRGYVLRRPPVHKRANSDETMRREARVLGALAGVALANLMFALPAWQASTHERTGWPIWLGEIVATAG
ncbi:MAG: phosphotransferase family protein, partial [Actinomycetota bacterium]